MRTDRPNTQRFTARITLVEQPQIVESLEREAYRQGSTVSAVIRRALREHLEATKR